MAKKKRKLPSGFLRGIKIDTSEAEFYRLKQSIKKGREKLLVSKAKRKKNGKAHKQKLSMRFNSGKKRVGKRYRNRRNIYGLRIYIRFVGVQYLTRKQGKYIKHIRFTNKGRWTPKSDSWVRGNFESILERMLRLYEGRIQPYSFNVTYLYWGDIDRLRIKRD